MKWHIENVLNAVRGVLAVLESLLAALSEPERKQFASLSTHLRAAEAEAVALRGVLPSENPTPSAPAQTPPRRDEDEETPLFDQEPPPRP